MIRKDERARGWSALAGAVLEGQAVTREEALAMVRCPEAELLELLAAAYRLRRHRWGDRVLLHILQNVRSGLCSEDCAFCAQSRQATGPVEKRELLELEEMLAGAREAKAAGAHRFCMVGAYKVPGDAHFQRICRAVERIKAEVGVRVCVSMGLLTPEQARALAAAGADRYNHNLESSRRHFGAICSTHSFDDRVRTIEAAHEAGLSVCSGGIVGLGEDDEDLVEMAFELARLKVESIPVNFFDPRPGTPLADRPRPSPSRCLKVLCMVRFVNPASDLRAAGGREVSLRSLQPMALYPCNSMFTRGYLTTGGNSDDEDLAMLQDLGFRPEN